MAACGPYDVYYREGASYSAQQRDLLGCKVKATSSVPESLRVATTPVFVSPVRTTCDGKTCTTTGGEVSGGNVYTYDANADLRASFERQCMADRHYSVVRLPMCSGAVRARITGPVPGALPKLGETSCAVASESGAVVVVTP